MKAKQIRCCFITSFGDNCIWYFGILKKNHFEDIMCGSWALVTNEAKHARLARLCMELNFGVGIWQY